MIHCLAYKREQQQSGTESQSASVLLLRYSTRICAFRSEIQKSKKPRLLAMSYRYSLRKAVRLVRCVGMAFVLPAYIRMANDCFQLTQKFYLYVVSLQWNGICVASLCSNGVFVLPADIGMVFVCSQCTRFYV